MPHIHPLDPLTADEIAQAAALVSAGGGLSGKAWFETIALSEPEKALLCSGAPPRRAHICCYDPETGETWEGIADLGQNRLVNWRHLPGMQARIGIEEFTEGGEVAKADPRVVAACAKRGIMDMTLVSIEAWAAGHFGIATEAGERIAYGQCFLRNGAGDNPYAKPIANLHPLIDLRRMRVIRVDDFGVVPMAPESTPITAPAFRADIKPLAITQPEGPSFTVEGHLVRWQNWRFRVGTHIRDGLILHEIGYEDKGRLRPIMHRASLSEMVVPYGDPGPASVRRNAFDTGEYGIGQLLDSLTLGCDCLGHIHYFDACFHDWRGKPRVIANAICMHEEDFGMLWKFTDWVTAKTTVKRSRRLVVSSLATIGNYVYGFFWYFYQDGTIGVEVKATGVPLPSGLGPGATPRYGTEVAPGIDAHVHQHVFSFRFDMTVDGEANSVSEMNFSSLPISPANPHGNAIGIEETPLRDEASAQRNMDLGAARYWKVSNPNVLNAHGAPVAYKLAPGANAIPFAHAGSPIGRRAGFMYKHFWATQYAPGELYAAGMYPNQHAGGDGLPRYTASNRSLENQNVVVWYTMNYHHLPRPEDWPVQPTVYASFHWMPSGFFDSNPALDVPSAQPQCC